MVTLSIQLLSLLSADEVMQQLNYCIKNKEAENERMKTLEHALLACFKIVSMDSIIRKKVVTEVT